MFQLTLPRSDRHSQIAVKVEYPGGSADLILDDSHFKMDVSVPPGVQHDDVEITAQFLNRRGQPDEAFPTILLKEKVARAPEDEPSQSAPAPEPTDGQAADIGNEDSRDVGSESVADAGQVGEADLKQDADAEPKPPVEPAEVVHEVKEVVTLQEPAVEPASEPTPSESPATPESAKAHHKPRQPK